MKTYEVEFTESVQNSENFYKKLADGIDWMEKWKKIRLDSEDKHEWYSGGTVDVCYNLVDRHIVAGRGNSIALIYTNPMIPITKEITYLELQEKVAKLAGALATQGVKKGDKVIIFMPTIPETVIGMLATLRLGAVHAIVFSGYGSPEVTAKINHLQPKVILTASCGIEPKRIIRYKKILDEAITNAIYKPKCCIIYQRYHIESAIIDSDLYLDWDKVTEHAQPHQSVAIDSNDPIYILYTSGTTGEPKGVVRTAAGYLVSLAYSMPNYFGLKTGDIIMTTSDFGWIVGHSYMVYAPLISGVTTIIYEGKPVGQPDASTYFRTIQRHKVNVLFTIPTILRLLKREKDLKSQNYDLSSLVNLVVAGEHCDHSTRLWAEETFRVPVVNHWWQTELGFPAIATCLGFEKQRQPQLSCGKPTPGFQMCILREDGTEAKTNEIGALVIKLPLPPGVLHTLYDSAARCHSIYYSSYPGYYDTKDLTYKDKNGYFYVTMRADDVINVSGHRISTCALEDIILKHSKVVDAAVIGIPDDIKGSLPFCFFVTEDEDSNSDIRHELIDLVRQYIGPVANFHKALRVADLPRTRSGKICRRVLVELINNPNMKVPLSVDNPQSVKNIKKVLNYK